MVQFLEPEKIGIRHTPNGVPLIIPPFGLSSKKRYIRMDIHEEVLKKNHELKELLNKTYGNSIVNGDDKVIERNVENATFKVGRIYKPNFSTGQEVECIFATKQTVILRNVSGDYEFALRHSDSKHYVELQEPAKAVAYVNLYRWNDSGKVYVGVSNHNNAESAAKKGIQVNDVDSATYIGRARVELIEGKFDD